MDYKIAIPSYNRLQTLKDKTLFYLNECGIEKDRITIFVADEEQQKIYNVLLEDGYKIVIGEPGMTKVRNFIRRYYGDDEFVINMDDDIKHLSKLTNGKLEPFYRLDDLIKLGFVECQKQGTKIWGISAVENPFYMSHGMSTSLKFIVGCFFGVINDKRNHFQVPDHLLVKSDYDITIKHYITFGKVIRFNGFCPKTKYYTEAGGLQGIRKVDDSKWASEWLSKTYPDYVSIKGVAGNGHLQISLRHKKSK